MNVTKQETYTLGDLVRLYRKSYDFTSLSENTKRIYKYNLEVLTDYFGDIEKADLETYNFARSFADYVQDLREDTPVKARQLFAVCRLTLEWCVRNGHINNHALGRLKMKFERSIRRNNAWTDKDIKRISGAASPAMRDFIFLALHTGLRRCDLIGLSYADITPPDKAGMRYIIVKQSKTGDFVTVALCREVERWLKKRALPHGRILRDQNGDPWTERKFSYEWYRLRLNVECGYVTPHGLRKTAVTRLMNAGCTVAEISAQIGWSLKSVADILDAHYFTQKKEVATQAVRKINKTYR